MFKQKIHKDPYLQTMKIKEDMRPEKSYGRLNPLNDNISPQNPSEYNIRAGSKTTR
jgi:hypothetical protein